MTETAITAPGEGTVRASHLAAPLVCLAVLLAPAWWNGYPLLQYDTGGYLARWYEGYLVPSRSTVFGLFLHLGEGLHFLARAPPAGRMHGLGNFAGVAGVRTWRRTVALGHCRCRSRVCHGIAIPR